MNLFLFALLTACPIIHTLGKKLPFPKEFQKCRRDDPALGECVRDAVQKAVPYLAKGMPKYGIIPVDPMITERISLYQGYGPVNLNITASNIITRGNSYGIVQQAHFDVANHYISAKVYFPNATLDGHYKLKGRIFLFPIEGDGTFHVELEDISSDVAVEGVGELRDGVEHMKIINAPVDVKVKHIKLHFDNLFNTDGALGKNVNWFLNRFADRIYRELKPLTDKTEGDLVRKLAQPFFDKVPYTELFY